MAEDDVVGEREQIAGDSGEEIDGGEAEGAEERLTEETEVPETPHVGTDVDEAYVDEGGGEEAPPLAVSEDEIGIGGAVVDQLIDGGLFGRDAVEDHPEEDGAVDPYEDVGGGGGEDIAAAGACGRRGRFLRGEDLAFWILGKRHGCS